MMNIYADIFGRSRTVIALIAVLFSSLAGYGFSFLRVDDVPRKLFASNDDEYRQLEKLFHDFGSDDNECVVVLESNDLFTPESVDVIRTVAQKARAVPGIVSVQSLADVTVFPRGSYPRALLPVKNAPERVFSQSRQDAFQHPLVRGQLISPDGRITLVFARIDTKIESIEDVQPIVEQIRSLAEESAAGTKVKAAITGVPALRVEVIQSLRRIQVRYTILGVSIAFIVGIFIFRRPSAVLIVTLPAFVAVFWMLGFLGLLGESLNVINSVMPPMILVIAFTDSVHLLANIRAAREQGLSRIEACQSGIRHVGLACFMASFTTAIGFASLYVANVETIQRLGVDTALGVMIGYCSTLTLVPLLASTPLGDGLLRNKTIKTSSSPVDWLVKLVTTVVSWPRTVAIIGTILTFFLAWVSSYLQPDNRLTETLPTDSKAYQTMAHCDEAFGGVLMAQVVIDWPETVKPDSPDLLQVLRSVHAIFEKDPPKGESGKPLLMSPISILNVFQSLPGGEDRNAQISMMIQHIPGLNLLVPTSLIRRFVREDLRRAIVSVHIRDIGSQVYQPVFREVGSRLKEIEERHPGFKLALTGTTVVASLKMQEMIVSMNQGLLTAGVIIFATMALAFRSFLLGALCIIPNIFPLVLVAAGLVLFDQPLQMATVIVFNIGIGMTVDNTIHLITRFQHEFPLDWNLKESIRRTGVAIGQPLLSTVVVLLAGFGSLMTSSIPVTQLFSLLVCAILSSALIGDLVLLPAFLGTFVRPPKRRVPGTSSHPNPRTAEASQPVIPLSGSPDPTTSVTQSSDSA